MMTVAAHRWGLRIALAQVLGLGLAAFAAAQEAPATTRREPAKRSEPGRDAGQMKSQDAHFAACLTLVAQLQETADNHGEEVLERRFDAWSRLLVTFRAVFGGVQHERMKLPAYAGNLFDP